MTSVTAKRLVIIGKENTTIIDGGGSKKDIQARVSVDSPADRGDQLRIRP